MINRIFSHVFEIFENPVRAGIGYVSAVILAIGSAAWACRAFGRGGRAGGSPGRVRKSVGRLDDWFARHPVPGKKAVPAVVFVALSALWVGSSFGFLPGFFLCALVMAWLMLKCHGHARAFMLVSVALILVSLAPLVFRGQDVHVKVFDSLDSAFPLQRILAESGLAFSLDPHAAVDRVMNGLPLSGFFNSGYNVMTVLHLAFRPFTAYAINMFLMAFAAFFGMYLLLRDFVVRGEAQRWIAMGAGLCFSLLPFYPPVGISIAGLPLLFYCFLKLRAGESKPKYFLFIAFFPFYSTLVHAGMFALVYLGVILLADILKNRKCNVPYFFGLAILVLGYLFTNFHLIYSFVAPGFASYREEIRVLPLSTAACLRDSINSFLFDKTHLAMAQGVFVIFCAALAVVSAIFKKADETGKMLFLLVLVFFQALLWGFKYWAGFAPLRENFQFLNALNIGRFFWLNPFLWYVVFALSLLVVSRLKHGKALALFLLIGQLLFLFTGYNWEYRELLGRRNHISASLTYREFYSRKLFENIAHFIARPRKDYRIVCLGIPPGIASYNGFYTLDGYANLYPLAYKKKFRRIMEKELAKSLELRRVFDDNGNRCYLLSAELHNDRRRGRAFALGITKKTGNLQVRNLELNTAALAEMGGEYIFSAVRILHGKKIGLALAGVFEEKSSPWKIHLYKVAPAGEA